MHADREAYASSWRSVLGSLQHASLDIESRQQEGTMELSAEEVAVASDVEKFDPTWDAQTVQAAFDESVALYGRVPDWADAIDKKVITVFTLATGIAGVS